MWAVPTNTPTTLKICTVVKQANITTVVAQYKSGITVTYIIILIIIIVMDIYIAQVHTYTHTW